MKTYTVWDAHDGTFSGREVRADDMESAAIAYIDEILPAIRANDSVVIVSDGDERLSLYSVDSTDGGRWIATAIGGRDD